MGVSTEFSYKNAPIRPAIPPMYIIPGIPRFRFPDFSVMISPRAPYRIPIPCPMAFCINITKNPIFSSSLLNRPVFMPAAHSYPVIDKELTAQNKEQDDTCYDIRSIFIQIKLGSDLPRSLLHEHQEK